MKIGTGAPFVITYKHNLDCQTNSGLVHHMSETGLDYGPFILNWSDYSVESELIVQTTKSVELLHKRCSTLQNPTCSEDLLS